MSDDNQSTVPTYRALLERTDAPPGSSWGVFGAADQVGSINFLSPQRTLAALKSVRSGEVISLDYPISHFDPPTALSRRTAQHVITQTHPNQRDDHLNAFYLQGSSQIDGLRHRRHEKYGFYNGVADEQITPDSPELGISHWADRGIVGRGILLDVARHVEAQGRSLDHDKSEPFGVDLLDEVAKAANVVLTPGDIVLVRTGFSVFFDSLTPQGRRDYASNVRSAGLVQAEATLEWIWDNQLAMIASDNPGVEVHPAIADSTFVTEHDHGMMHQAMLGLLGLALGELWDLEKLADACQRRDAYDFLLVAKPLAIVGGVGSPPNAVAIL